jgi:hypothetical protein
MDVDRTRVRLLAGGAAFLAMLGPRARAHADASRASLPPAVVYKGPT